MAAVRLSDVIIPEVYESYGEVNSPELTAFLTSGVVARSATLDAYAQGPSKSGHVPYWLDLDQTIEENYSNDDPADPMTPNKINMAELAFRKTYVNQAWSSMDLVSELLGQNPMQQIKRRTSTYWLRRLQRRIIAISRGILAKNIATNSGDMLIDISLEAGNSATDANKFSADAVVRAAFTMGDMAGGFVGMAVHSTVKARMVLQDEIEYIRLPSDGSVIMERYKGMAVITDDNMPVIAGTTNGFRYVSVLFGRGAIGLGVGTPEVPVETKRDPDKGNGGGMDTLHERKTWLLHPAGHNWVEGSLAEFSPTVADLALSAHWARVYARKQTPIAFLITNG